MMNDKIMNELKERLTRLEERVAALEEPKKDAFRLRLDNLPESTGETLKQRSGTFLLIFDGGWAEFPPIQNYITGGYIYNIEPAFTQTFTDFASALSHVRQAVKQFGYEFAIHFFDDKYHVDTYVGKCLTNDH